MIRSSTLVLGLVLAGAALAQAPAPAPAPTAPLPSVAAHACTKPEFPGKVAPQSRQKKWSEEFKAYVECLKTYIGERNATIEANSKAAKSAVDEFNTNVAEFNAQVKSLSE